VPWWAKDPAIGNRLINARAETLAQKSAFKELVDRRRCLILADGFYEWRKEGKHKVPVWIYLKSKQPFAFAGLWDAWRKPDGGYLKSCAIITTEPNDLMRRIHDRMPVILGAEDEAQWVDVEGTTFDLARRLLRPFAADLMDAHDVSTLVNSPRNDLPACVSPI
jgi:putative SOS response-associated peptidase YedK